MIERNRLVHQDLLRVDLSSDEACRTEIARLDEQDERIRQQIQELKQLRQMQESAISAFISFLASPEFMQALQGSADGA